MRYLTKFSGCFHAGYRRDLPRRSHYLFSVLGIGLCLFQVWSVMWGKIDPMNQMAIHLSFILSLTFVLYGYSTKTTSSIPSKVDIVFVLLSLGLGFYFTIHAERLAVRIPIMDSLSGVDVVFGLIFVCLSMEAARRTIGVPIIIIVLIGIGYALFGHHLNGLFYHREMSPIEILDELAYSFNGLWGSPISVAASFVFMFLLFGSFLQKAGAGEFFFKLSTALAGRSKGGAAKVTILASALFGSISGSPTANVVTTGAFTIPVSKKSGYKASFAAAIEAAASTGGSILPPIMGSSAFLMAAVTQLSYGSIVVAAIIPSILYYISLLTMVHFEALRLDLPQPDKKDLPCFWDVLKEGWYYFIPLILLIFFLIQGYSPTRTAFFAILSVVIVSWFRKRSRMGIKEIGAAMVSGAKSSVPVTTACAAAGLVIAGIMSTGLGGKLTSIVLGITQGMFVPTLLLVMVICVVLGMGMPVAAAYILTAMLAAPALIELGVSTMSAHLFIVYFSIFSAITPPVAVAAFAAAGIAGAKPNRVGLDAVRIGVVGFVVPFLFVFEPSLLLIGPTSTVIGTIFTAVFGVVSLAAGLIGWLLKRAVFVERVILIVCGILAMYPGAITDGLGIVGFLLVAIYQRNPSWIMFPLAFTKKHSQ
ncbi:TRAP transporter, 4TM/12TM fusion protein [Oceanobacillus limi]|uniref:TRAP transporter, 4TM/12TM fusion protein n=1 Tax=Oceanobacillus limi TaxID=930131 RepID=A0A1I0CAB6_9BACI|nr:TRAP transporter fused permease subunit [Oceanobacillus limi]SET16438.1 TRAP transporter, 4TM/12TM fusion protein [Oceanobacillus limi]